MIDQITIDRIIDTARIEDVIQDFVPLKRRGVNMIGLCPFHNEKTPSFTVSPAKGIFKCFGCGKGGNAVHFIMEHEHLDWLSAIKYLAKKYRIEVEERELSEEEKQRVSERESMMIVNSWAQKYFSRMLNDSEEGIAIGLSYFRERGFNDTTIEKFQLGYCPDGRSTFTEEALKNAYKLEFLEKTGLSIVKDNSRFDRFSGRVMFPVHSISGRVIAFGGRTLKSDKSIAKYLNSPESEVYHKSQTLYGLFQSKNAIIRENKCYLVEGYTDVISLHQAGIENVVASSGTSLTREQIALIRRFSEDVTILYDGDSAGIKASIRGIDMLLEEGLNVRVLLFPDNEDPDSFARKHNHTFVKQYLQENEQDFIHFKSKLLSEEAKNDPIKMSAMISDIVRSISVISDSIKRTIYIQECSKLLGFDENVLFSESAKMRKRMRDEANKKDERDRLRNQMAVSPPVPAFVNNVYCEPQEKEIIRFLLLFGAHPLSYSTYRDNDMVEVNTTVAEYIIGEIRNDELRFQNLVYHNIFEESEAFILKGTIPNDKTFINHSNPELSRHAYEICAPGYQLSSIWARYQVNPDSPEKNLNYLIPKLVMTYKRKILEMGRDQKAEELKAIQHTGNLELIRNLETEIQSLLSLINTVSKSYNNVILR